MQGLRSMTCPAIIIGRRRPLQAKAIVTPPRLAADAPGAPGRPRLLTTRCNSQAERWKRKSSRAITVFDALQPANEGPSVAWAPMPHSWRESFPRARYPGGGSQTQPDPGWLPAQTHRLGRLKRLRYSTRRYGQGKVAQGPSSMVIVT
jgi:hypothetical protein